MINALKGGLLKLVEHYAKSVNQEKLDKIINQLDPPDDSYSLGPSTQRTYKQTDPEVDEDTIVEDQ